VSVSDVLVRDAARGAAPELTGVLGAAGTAVSAETTQRIGWARAKAGAQATSTAAKQLLALAYLLAHRTTADLMGSQGSTSAPIGSGATAGAVTSTAVGGMSIGYGAGVIGGFTALSADDAEFATTQYGRAWLSLRASLTQPNMVVHR
jgi:hypothetical protein